MPLTLKQAAEFPPPAFTLTARDPLARNLLRFWIFAAKAHGRIPDVQIKQAEAALKAFDEWQAKHRRKR
jgi:uncharacterized membrane protein YebE (DUF533 family)